MVTLSPSLANPISLSSSRWPDNATLNATDNDSASLLRSTGSWWRPIGSLFSRKNTSVQRSERDLPLKSVPLCILTLSTPSIDLPSMGLVTLQWIARRNQNYNLPHHVGVCIRLVKDLDLWSADHEQVQVGPQFKSIQLQTCCALVQGTPSAIAFSLTQYF